MILNSPTISGSLTVTGNIITSGSITISGSIASASYASNAELLDGLDSTVFTLTSSFNAQTASFTAFTASLNAFSASINTATSSFSGRVGALESYTASLNLKTASFATTGSNNFTSTQHIADTTNPTGFDTTASLYSEGGLGIKKDAYISSSLYIKGNLTVYGTQSVSYITSSQLNISTNIITVNTSTPSIRFGGLAVQDSGSVNGLTGSLLWDSQNNSWLYNNPSGSGNYDSSLVIMGPRNSSTLGNEVGLSCNYLVQGHGHHHTTSSGIFHDGSTTCIGTGMSITNAGVTNFASSVTATQGNFYLSTVSGSIGSVKNLTVSNFNGAIGDWAGLNFAYFNNATNFAYIGAVLTNGNSNAAADLVFGTKASNAATAVTEYMRITCGGNVGIGTSSPRGVLDVRVASDRGITVTGTVSSETVISGMQGDVSANLRNLRISGNNLLFNTGDGSNSTGTEKMTITSTGNVGIGTNSPSGTDITLNVRGISTNTTSMVIAESYDAGSMVSLYSGASSGDDPSLIYLKALRFGSGNKSTSGYVERMRITCGGVVKVKNTTIPEGDDIGLIQVENTTAAAGSGANAGITVKSYNGTAQIMQWENYGIRLGNRIKTNTGAGGVYFTYGNDTVGMILTSGGHVTKPCSAAFHASINTTTCIGIGGKQIQFNCVLYNAGNAYDGTTSTFTAPVSGMYQFNFVFLNQNVQNTTGGHGYLSTNYGVGTYYFSRFGCQSGEHGTGYGGFVPMQGSVAVYLPSGYKACVGAFWDADGAFTHVSTAWASFTGYLVG